jgi:hypothetical protein
MQWKTFQSSKVPSPLLKRDRVRFRAVAVHKRTIREPAKMVRRKPCAGIWPQRLAGNSASDRPNIGSLRRRICVRNSREIRHFRAESPRRLNALSVVGGSIRNRTAETRFCSPVWLGYRPVGSSIRRSPFTVTAKPCAGFWRQRLAGDFAPYRPSIGSLRRRIRVRNPREIRHSQTELSWRLNDLSVGGGPSRNRTGVQGFAVLCVTTPPSGLGVSGSLPRRSPSGQPRGSLPCLSMKGGWRDRNLPI